MSKVKLSKKPKVVIEFEDQDIELERPNAFDMADMEDRVKDLMDNGSSRQMIEECYNYVVSLGMPKDLAKQLDPDHYQEIFEALRGSKKN